MSNTSLKNQITSIMRNRKRGLTVREIDQAVISKFYANTVDVPAYSSVRARVAELTTAGTLVATGVKELNNTTATVFTFNRAAL